MTTTGKVGFTCISIIYLLFIASNVFYVILVFF